MRPVNLLSPADRHGENAPMRTGALPYLVVGALVAVLAGVSFLVITGNQISDSKAELAQLERENDVAGARAERLAVYTQFRELREQQVSTVSSLADSRFDWQRVMRELSLILPSNTWLVGLTASASPLAELGGSGGAMRESIPGPALEINGCASSQDAVAGFVTSLKDIDGVTRVGVQSSELSGPSSGAGVAGEGSEAAGAEDCRTRNFIAKFSIVVAFDAAPVSAAVVGTEVSVPAPAESAEAPEGEAESSEGG